MFGINLDYKKKRLFSVEITKVVRLIGGFLELVELIWWVVSDLTGRKHRFSRVFIDVCRLNGVCVESFCVKKRSEFS